MYQHKSISLADQIFEKLEKDILTGKYSYGEVLTETKLSEELGVSRTPVREALRRLAQEKLIKETQKGTIVLGISKEDLEDIYAIRMPLEAMAVTRFIKNMTEDSIKILRDIVAVQEFYGTRKDFSNISDKDSEFHEAIYRNCGSHILEETLVPLHRKVVKFRKASIEHSGRAEKSIEEHKEILKAIENKDIKKAVELVAKHANNAKQNILREE